MGKENGEKKDEQKKKSEDFRSMLSGAYENMNKDLIETDEENKKRKKKF